MPEPKQHLKNRNLVESILSQIPGFRGYLEKENRRASDQLQREWLADRLEASKRTLDDYTRSLADAKELDSLEAVDRMRSRLDRLVVQLRGAMQGYSGFFDLVKVDTEMLDRVYEHDVQLMDWVNLVAEGVERLPDASGRPAERIQPLWEQIRVLEEEWHAREEILKGLD